MTNEAAARVVSCALDYATICENSLIKAFPKETLKILETT
jgi:uncharacterized protein (DUF2344 family)